MSNEVEKTLSEYEEKLREMQKALMAQRDAMELELQPLRQQREKLVAAMQKIEAELRPLNQKIQKAEKPQRELGMRIADIARALGAKTLRNA